MCTARPSESGSSFWRRIRRVYGDRYAVREAYQRRRSRRQRYRNGYYQRDFVIRVGTIRLRIARTREKAFCRAGSRAFSGGGRSGVTTPAGSSGAQEHYLWAVLAKSGDAIRLGYPARGWPPAGSPGCLKNRKLSAPPKGPRDKRASW
jgi:hypothetical protein